MVEEITFSPPLGIDLADDLRGYDVMSMTIDAYGQCFILAVSEPANHRQINRRTVRVEKPQDFIVLQTDGDFVVRYEIQGQFWNYHNVQPLPDGELLLVCGRSYYRRPDDFDLNGRVLTCEGQLVREFLLGDGISHVQTTGQGDIWVSYFDEGVLGNYGWPQDNIIGSAGLVQWDKNGGRLYGFAAPDFLGHMVDCYAMNVMSDAETWIYYYTGFPLVQIRNHKTINHWQSIIYGAYGFCIWGDRVLFTGSYEHYDRLHLVRLLWNHTMEPVVDYVLDSAGYRMTARGQLVYLRKGTMLYRVDLEDIAL